MKNLRRFSQGFFLLAFFFLFVRTESTGNDILGYPVKLFLDFDPLILFTTLLAAHSAAETFYYALFTLLITVVLGRVFCGWICPLGTLHNIISFFKKKRGAHNTAGWFHIKYYILVFVLVCAVFSMQIVGILDPLSLLIRSLSLSINPLFNYATRKTFDAIYELDIPGIVTLSEGFYTFLKTWILAFRQPLFLQGMFIGVLFCLILGLNLLERRFWCRYLCPLGALLSILSQYSLLKRSVSEGCNECGLCAAACQGNAAPDKGDSWKNAECYYCFNCDDICPQQAVSFGFTGVKKSAGFDVRRRGLVFSACSALVFVPLLRSVPTVRSGLQNPSLIRPPGSLAEEDFLARCVKCGECMKVCLTNGLQPTFLEAGLEGIWSPMLVPRQGYCEYQCTLCGQVCPTGAITELSRAEKSRVKIGVALIDKGRCLPWAHGRPCIVCEEVCPTSKKAIWFEKVKVTDRNGGELRLQRPHVDLSLCIGCGICEAKCPVSAKPAIYVTSTGESRSEENQVLL